MKDNPIELLELFHRVILDDAGVFLDGGGVHVDDDGWERYHVDITKAPVKRDAELWMLHATIARRIASLIGTKNIHTYATEVAAAWTKLATEVEGMTYAEWRTRVIAEGAKKMKKPKTKSKSRPRKRR
jgi:hypothetical protein